MNTKITVQICLIAAMMAGSCKNTGAGEPPAPTEMARGSYRQEKNLVTVEPLERRTFMKQLVCNGKVEAQCKVSLQFQTQGTVAAVAVHDGRKVKKGQVLASLDKEQPTRRLEQARLAFDKAEMALADRLLDYGYSLDDTALIPAAQKRSIYINSGFLDARMALDDARYSFEICDLKAPFDGKVADVSGQAFQQAGPLCTLIDDSGYLLRFNILETEHSLVHVGQQVMASPFSDPETVLTGSVISINPTVDRNGQIAVTALLPGSDALMDGMNVRITVQNAVPGQLVVPKSAVVIRDDMEVLFRYADGRSLWTYVNVLMSNTTHHVVQANVERGASLSEGDLVITGGNLNLGDDTPVEIEQ